MKIFTIIFLIFSTTCCSFAFADVDGFRGIKWGEISDERVKNKEIVLVTSDAHKKLAIFSRKNDQLKMGSADLESIQYVFWKNKFYSVMVLTKGVANYESMKAAAIEKFGKGRQHPLKKEEFLLWNLDSAGASITFDESMDIGKLYLFSKKIGEERESFEASKAKDGAQSDF